MLDDSDPNFPTRAKRRVNPNREDSDRGHSTAASSGGHDPIPAPRTPPQTFAPPPLASTPKAVPPNRIITHEEMLALVSAWREYYLRTMQGSFASDQQLFDFTLSSAKSGLMPPGSATQRAPMTPTYTTMNPPSRGPAPVSPPVVLRRDPQLYAKAAAPKAATAPPAARPFEGTLRREPQPYGGGGLPDRTPQPYGAAAPPRAPTARAAPKAVPKGPTNPAHGRRPAPAPAEPPIATPYLPGLGFRSAAAWMAISRWTPPANGCLPKIVFSRPSGARRSTPRRSI